MIIGIDIPKGAEVVIDKGNEKVLIMFDERKTKMDLWKARFSIWLTIGNTVKEFYENYALTTGAMVVTNNDKLKYTSNR
jgi:hypothetical protein